MWLPENWELPTWLMLLFRWAAGLEHEPAWPWTGSLVLVPAVPLGRACPFGYCLKGSKHLFYFPLHIWPSLCLALCFCWHVCFQTLGNTFEWIICERAVWHYIDDAVDCKISCNVRTVKEKTCKLEDDTAWSNPWPIWCFEFLPLVHLQMNESKYSVTFWKDL